MNSDQQVIQSAYEEVVTELYANLFKGFAEAGGDAGQMQQAELHFSAGLGLARRTRDRALALLA